MDTEMINFIANMPKAELHVHIEGVIEPEKLLELARRNNQSLPYKTADEIKQAQDYPDPALDNFLRYHEMMVNALSTQQDFYEVMYNFLKKCAEEKIVYLEIMFGPQYYINRGIAFAEFFTGLNQGRQDGERDFGVASNLIMNFHRDESESSALAVLEMAAPFREDIVGVDLDNYEPDNFPLNFITLFDRARDQGYRLTSHCDCDQPNSVQHIWDCIDLLGVERIDHGVHVADDERLIEEVRRRKIGLTVCPSWRPSDPEPRRLGRLKQLFEAGLLVSINTDAPEEFANRYLTNTVKEVQRASQYSRQDLIGFMRNTFESSWLSEERKQQFIAQLDDYALRQGAEEAQQAS